MVFLVFAAVLFSTPESKGTCCLDLESTGSEASGGEVRQEYGGTGVGIC